MFPHKRKVKTTLEDEETAEDKVLIELADVVLENLYDEGVAELDPFDRYTNLIRTHFHSHTNEFNRRLIKGYRVLIKEIEQSKQN